ncbi:MAG: hypothetical protein HUU50_09745 [Candidatus Brocadiae bacterium]|nr:hypothetical protein [Candidatus Brocadiia bacterium]
MTRKAIPLKQKRLLLHQMIQGFFSCLGENQESILFLLQKLKDLRKENVHRIKGDLLVWLCDNKKNLPESQFQEKWISFLDRLISNLSLEQQKSYSFLEQGLIKNILDKIAKDCLTKKIEMVSNLSTELEKESCQKKDLQSELEITKEALIKTTEECQSLKDENTRLQAENQRLSANLYSQEDMQQAVNDYETMIREIREELEGKKNYDLWRLKVFYNKIASITNSKWEYPGVPKSDMFQPRSESVQKFLDSLGSNFS